MCGHLGFSDKFLFYRNRLGRSARSVALTGSNAKSSTCRAPSSRRVDLAMLSFHYACGSCRDFGVDVAVDFLGVIRKFWQTNFEYLNFGAEFLRQIGCSCYFLAEEAPRKIHPLEIHLPKLTFQKFNPEIIPGNGAKQSHCSPQGHSVGKKKPYAKIHAVRMKILHKDQQEASIT